MTKRWFVTEWDYGEPGIVVVATGEEEDVPALREELLPGQTLWEAVAVETAPFHETD